MDIPNRPFFNIGMFVFYQTGDYRKYYEACFLDTNSTWGWLQPLRMDVVSM